MEREAWPRILRSPDCCFGAISSAPIIADEVLAASIYRLMLYMLKVGLVGKVGSIATLSEMQFAEKCWLLPHEAQDTGRAVTVLIVSASG